MRELLMATLTASVLGCATAGNATNSGPGQATGGSATTNTEVAPVVGVGVGGGTGTATGASNAGSTDGGVRHSDAGVDGGQ